MQSVCGFTFIPSESKGGGEVERDCSIDINREEED